MESLAESPAVMTHASVPKEIRAELGILIFHFVEFLPFLFFYFFTFCWSLFAFSMLCASTSCAVDFMRGVECTTWLYLRVAVCVHVFGFRIVAISMSTKAKQSKAKQSKAKQSSVNKIRAVNILLLYLILSYSILSYPVYLLTHMDKKTLTPPYE